MTQHERDNIRPDHQDLPPEEINILRDGAHYGWPYCHSSRVPNPEFNDHGAVRLDRTAGARHAGALRPVRHHVPGPRHQAAGRIPRGRAGGLPRLVEPDEPTGAKVVRLRIRDGRPVGYEDFIVGWQGADGKRWGRPVDVVVARDGSVLVSDDQSGTVFLVRQR